jgi:hypothetical protein
MDLLNKELNLDVSHLILFIILIAVVLYVVKSSSENLEVPQANFIPCKCPSCADACYQRALNGQLPGCGGELNYDQCNNSYRKCLLFGCDVASGSTCNCGGKA